MIVTDLIKGRIFPTIQAKFSFLNQKKSLGVYSLTAVLILGVIFFAQTSFAISPTLAGIEVAALNYNEGQIPILITGAITVVDADSPVLASATVQITGNYSNGEDVLIFVNAFGITGSYDPSTGTMTLTGPATLANFRSALRSVTYQNTNNDHPSNLARTISFSVNDGTTSSNIVSRNINVTRVNDSPVVANLEPVPLAYTESDPATAVSSSVTIMDVDNINLASATVQITTGYNAAQDVLAFTNAFGISGSYAGGTLTLSGVASVSDYQSALRSITYSNTNTVNPSTTTRTVVFRANDGSIISPATTTRTITISTVNDAPVLSGIEVTTPTFTEGGAAMAITAAILVVDGDDASLNGASVQISGNYSNGDDILGFTPVAGISFSFDAATGTMTMTGVSSVTNYRTALRGITYRNINNADPSPLTRTISFTVNDLSANSNVVTRNISFTAVNDIPVLSGIEVANVTYTEEQAATPITSSIVITDIDNNNVASATVQITTGFNSTYDVLAFADGGGITSAFNTTTGMLTLTGAASVATYQAALRSVTYQNTNNINPTTTTRTIRFIVNDGVASSVAVSRNVTFTAINDAPVLSAIEVADLSYSEGQTATNVTASLLALDGDSPNLMGATVQITGNFLSTEDVLSFTNAPGVTGALNAATGTITFSGTGTVANYQAAIRSVKYRNSNNNTPSPLTRTLSYTVTDGSLSSNTVTRGIAVTPINDAPVAVNDNIATPEETPVDIQVLLNDTDVDNAIDPTTVAIVTGPANGTISINAVTGVITYTPNAEFSGSNPFTYTVKDITGTISNTATVTVTVSLINDAPYFTAGTDITVAEDAGIQTIVGWATTINDGDPFTAQTLTFVLTNTNTALFATQPAINGTTGNLTFRSATNASGTATLTVALRDNGLSTSPNVNISNTQTFTITVQTVNDAPVGVDDFFSTSSNTPLAANAKSNDSDPENNTTTLSATPVVAPLHGSVVINSNGTFIYTPEGAYTGTDTFTYAVCDDGTDNGLPAPRCGQAVVSVTVNPPNPYFNIVGNNSIELSTNSFILTKALNTQNGAVWNRMPLDLRYSFELNLNAIFSEPGIVRDVGADGIIFVLQRDTTPPPLNVPDLPIYARGSTGEYLGVGGITPSIGIEVDTYQNGGEPVYDHIAISKNGSVYDIVASPVPALVDASNNPLNIEDGVVHAIKLGWDNPSKTLRISFDGIEKIVYTNDIITSIFVGDPKNVYWGFSSSTGGQNNYQGVYDIDMEILNLAPVAGTDAATTNEDTPVSGMVMINDLDPESGSLHVVAENKITAHGQVAILADGTFTYTPNANFNGLDIFTYQVCDGFTPNGCSIGTVNVTVVPVQDAPIGHPDNLVVYEDNPLDCGCVLHNDEEVDGEPLVALLAQPPAHGTVVDENGVLIYYPNPDYFGTDTFTYYANDGIENSSETLVTITILPVNDAPIAVNDQIVTDEDIAVNIPLLINDRDVDDILVASMIVVVNPPAHGTVNINSSTGAVTYTPVLNYNGIDSFSYSLKDASDAVSNTATVNITINAVNDVPIANPDFATTLEEEAVFIPVLSNDTDVDNALVATSLVVASGPSNGSAIVESSTGMIIYTPKKDFTGTDSFTYTVKDTGGGTSVPAIVTITVYPINDAPVAVDDAASTLQNTMVDINILLNDFDVDNNIVPSSVIITSYPQHGTVSYNVSTGVASFTPETDFLGNDSFTYTIQDPDGLTSPAATVSIVVLPPNKAPHAVDDGPITHALLLPLTIDVLANDYDEDNDHDELSIVSVSNPSVGSVSIVDGKIVYQPEGTISGTVTFTYSIQDPEGLTDEAVVTIEYVYNPLTVSEGYSPNNDSNNDTWYILSIENYPNNSVKVFDRWGLMVYQKQHYENSNAPWDGRGNTGQQSGKLLDQGTYYYMLETGSELRMLSGYVVIVR